MKTLKGLNGIRKEEKPDQPDPIQQVIEEYGMRRPLYQDFAEVIRFILQEELHAKSIRVHSIEVRGKSIESFRRKISQVGETGPGEPAPKDPLAKITDLAGVRVITFFPKTLVGCA